MSPFESAWILLKDFYIDDNDNSRGFFTTPGEDSEDALTHFRNIRSPYTRGGSFPRLQPDGSFVGARVGRDTDDSDESIQDLADTLAHEHVHNLIEGEMEDFATEKFGSPKLLAPVFGEPQPREQPSGRRRNRFQKRPILNQSEIDADKERLALRQQAKDYAHEYGAHQADQSSQPGVNAFLAERPDTGDMYSQIRADQFGYYPSMQEQQQVASMMPPPIQQPDMIQAGEPMELAWLLLKDFYIRRPDSDRGGFYQRAGQEESDLISSLDAGTPKGYPGRYKNRFMRRKDSDRRNQGFTRVLRDGKTDYASDVYDEDTDSMVGPYNRPQQSPEEFRQGSSVPRRQPVDESERQAGVTPTGGFIGVGLDSSYDDSDESIQRIADIMSHEFTHAAIDPEIEDFVTSKYGSREKVAPIRAKAPDDDELESIWNSLNLQGLSPTTGEILNQAELDTDEERIANRNKLRTFAHEYGAHQADQASQPGVNQYLAGRKDTRDMYQQIMENKFGFYPTFQMQRQVANMLPPAPVMQEQVQPEQPMQPEQQPTQ